MLASVPTKSGNERSYDGFDISPGMFPSVPRKGMSFHVQDMFQLFPAELHGKYDFIHLRFVISAIREDRYKVVLENLVPLLSNCTLTPLHCFCTNRKQNQVVIYNGSTYGGPVNGFGSRLPIRRPADRPSSTWSPPIRQSSTS